MSDTTEQDLNISNSHSQLIEVQVNHVGVTAKLQSPLKRLLPGLSSSFEADVFHHGRPQYDVFQNELQGDSTETTELSSPHVLYEMHADPPKRQPNNKLKPNRIEFQRYCKGRRPQFAVPLRKKIKKKQQSKGQQQHSTFFERIVQSLDNMCKCQSQHCTRNIIDDLPEPQWNKKAASRHTCIGVYPFEHGCADYLSTTDTHPKINSIVLAERASTYATHFWGELFGFLHIAVAFFVAFILQSYRFILYSLVNSLLVGLLHTTSDYMLKPTLAVIFNGFLQPPMIFVYNVLCSLRDILEPVADTFNNLMKPAATLAGSIRLINVNYRNVRRLAKDV